MDQSSAARALGLRFVPLKDAAACDFVVLAVPVQYLEECLLEVKKHVKPGALVADVSSVKVKPIELMLKHLPESVEILGTHPLFGPQSGKHGIEGLNMVLCPVRTTKLRDVQHYFVYDLRLNVLERSAEVHDRQMAYVQALTHFIGRAVNELDIPDVDQKTPAYQYLLDIKRNLGQDSMDLFLTIEQQNPFAAEVRAKFIDELQRLDQFLLGQGEYRPA